MSNFVYKDAKVFLGGYNLSCKHNSVNVNYSADLQDCTTLCNSERRRVAGLYDAQIDGNAYFDRTPLETPTTLKLVDQVIHDSVGISNTPITVLPDGDSDGDKAIFLNAINNNINHNGTVGGLLNLSYMANGDGSKLGNGKLVANEEAVTSTDTTTGVTDISLSNDWSSGSIQSEYWINAANNGSTVVSVGTSSISYSTDGGDTWDAAVPHEAVIFTSVCYGNGQFVAVSSSGTLRVATSPDGITWTGRNAAEANSWRSVIWVDSLNLYVAVAESGTNRVMTSPDGITWTPRAAASAIEWKSVIFAGGTINLLVAVAATGTSSGIMTSPDGITWTTRDPGEDNQWNDLAFDGTTISAVAINGTNRVTYSTDGINWTPAAAPQANLWISVDYGDGLFVAVSRDGANRVMTSPDGITYTVRDAAEQNSWNCVCYCNDRFIAMSYDGTNRVMYFGGKTIRATLHVYAVKGVLPTLDVVLQQDVSSGFASPNDIVTFTQATTETSEYAEYSTIQQLTDDYYRLSYTIGGTNPEFSFAVSIALQ